MDAALHDWSLTPKQAIALQSQLAKQLEADDRIDPVTHIAGVDIGFEEDGSITRAAVVVLPIGAGMTNLIFAAKNAKVVMLCPPSLTSFKGQNMCDWPRDHYIPKFLSHLQMTTTILRHGRGTGGGGGFNVRAAPKPPVLRCKVSNLDG